MKKNLVMALGAALTLGGLSAQAQTTAPTTAPATTTAAAMPKIGYTSMDALLAQAPEAKDIQNQITIQQQQLQSESERLQKEFESKLQVYEKGAAQMSDVIKADREKELQGLQTRYQDFQKNAQTTLQNKYQQLVSPVLQKIQKTIDVVAQENGYSHVFNVDAGQGTAVILLYAPKEGNITDLVLRKMGVTPGAAPATGTTPARQGGATTAPKKN